MIGSELLRYKSDQKYLTFDYETLCLNLVLTDINQPWQLGWMLHQGIKLIEEHEDWLDIGDKPPISKEAAFMTNFTLEEYLRKRADITKIRDKFEQYLYDDEYIIITANGARFDQFIDNLYRRMLGRPIRWDWIKRHIDIQVLSKAHELQVAPPKIGTNEWVAFNEKVSAYHTRKLKSSIKYLSGVHKLEYREDLHHISALWDVSQTKLIFDKQLWQLELELA